MKISGKESLCALFRQLRIESGKTLREVVNDNPELFHDIPHLSKVEHGQQAPQSLDKISEYLEYYGYEIHVIKNDKLHFTNWA